MMTSDDAARVEDVREEDARQRSLQIAAAEESAERAVEDTEPSPDAEIAYATRSGRQHDHDDTAAYARTRPRPRRYGPGR